MNKILVLKDVAYAAVSSGNPISTVADLDRLAQGAVAAFDQDGDIIQPGSLSGTYTSIFFAVGLAEGYNLSVPIPVFIDKWNVQAYRAAVKPTIQIGDTTTVAQVDTITLTGTSGTANITLAGGLTRTATFGTSLTATAAAFVTANAAAYLAQGIVLTSNGADLIFTAQTAGTGFTSPAIANASGDLAGSVVNTTANKESGTTLQFMPVGDYSVTVLDNTFTNRYSQERKDATGYRQVYHTEENVVDDVVMKLNAEPTFVTAVKTGNSTDGWGVAITPIEEGRIANVSLRGMFVGTPVYSDGTNGSVAQVFSLGRGEDVRQLEQDFSVYEGNSNSIDYPAEYFSKPLEALSSVNYEMINLLWKGTSSGPSNSKIVANNRLVFAGVDGSTVIDNLQTILNGVFTTTGSKTVS